MARRMLPMSWILVSALLWGTFSAASASSEDLTPGPEAPFQVHTNPAGAKIYVNWDLLGTTPLTVPTQDLQPGDLFVAWLPDHQASYRQVIKPRSFYLRLMNEGNYPVRRWLLTVVGDDGTWLDEVTAAFSGEKIFVHPPEDTELLERHVVELGNRSVDPLLAWARSYFGAAYWLVIRLPDADPRLDVSRRVLTVEPLDAAAPPNPEPAEPTLEVRLIDLRHGSLALDTLLETPGIDHRNRSRRAKARRGAVEGLLETLEAWVAQQEAEAEVVTVIDLDATPETDRTQAAPSTDVPEDPDAP